MFKHPPAGRRLINLTHSLKNRDKKKHLITDVIHKVMPTEKCVPWRSADCNLLSGDVFANITSSRDSGRESRYFYTHIYGRKVCMSGRPAMVTLFRRLYLWNAKISRAVILIRCHHPINYVFDRHRYPPMPATVRGTCKEEGVGDTLP